MINEVNVVFINHDPLTPALKKMCYIEELSKLANVKFLSLRNVFHSKKKYCFTDELTEEFDDINSFFALKKKIKEYNKKNTFIFLEIPNNHLASLYVTSILKGYKLCNLMVYKSFGIIQSSNTRSLGYLLEKIITPGFFIKRFLRSIIHIEYDIVFSPGTSSSCISAKKVVPINSVIKSPQKKQDKGLAKYCVYIDQGFPTHIDLIRLGYKCPNISDFIDSFNSFFSFIESKYDLEVVIAKHPKSTIDDKMYNGRKVFVYKTEELIENASLVLGHISLVQNYAILKHLPIILFYNQEMLNYPNNFYLTMKKLQNIIGCPLINIENLPNDIDLKVDKQKYDDYINQFIIGEKGRMNHQIIIEELLENVK